MSGILHVTQCLGGVETYIRSFHDHDGFADFKERMLVAPSACALTKEWENCGGTVDILPMSRELSIASDVRATLSLFRTIRRHKPNVLHLHSSKAGAIGRAAALFCKLLGQKFQVVYTPHAYYYLALEGHRRFVFLWIERILSYFTDRLLATSPSEASRSIEDVGYPQRKVVTVSNGVATTPVHTSPLIGKSHAPFTIIFVGRICHQKNVELLIETVAQFRSSESVVFQIVGAGHYDSDRQQLDALLETAKVDTGLVEIIPWLDHEQVLDKFRQADVCLVTSRYESFGYVAAEAAAAAIPVVATNVDGLKDIVEDGKTGFLLTDPSGEQLASYIRRLLDDPQLSISMGRLGNDRINRYFNIAANSQLMRKFYSSIS